MRLTWRLRPSRKVTLLDVATHTAGIPNVGEPRNHSTLAELVAMVSQRPLDFEPGSRYTVTGNINTVLQVHHMWILAAISAIIVSIIIPGKRQK